jgi:hypothetical protein
LVRFIKFKIKNPTNSQEKTPREGWVEKFKTCFFLNPQPPLGGFGFPWILAGLLAFPKLQLAFPFPFREQWL